MPRPREVRVGEKVVAVYAYGVPQGQPVPTFHGTPACGAGFAWPDEPARARVLRVLAPDRPGTGRSTAHSGWGVHDYPRMIVALAGARGLERFGVWRYSGGGPYAVACAAMLGERVTKTAVARRLTS